MFRKTGAPESGAKVAEPIDVVMDDDAREFVDDDVGKEDEDEDAVGKEQQ